MLFQSPILIIVYLTSMLFMSWQLTLFVFILLPIMGLLIGRVGKNLKRRSWEGQTKMEYNHSGVHQASARSPR